MMKLLAACLCIAWVGDLKEHTLKQLEADGLILRKEYPQIPPKVEYSLSERGKSLMPILDQMCEWGDQNRKDTEFPFVEII